MQKSRILMFIFLFISYFYKLFKGDYFFFILRSYKHNLFGVFFQCTNQMLSSIIDMHYFQMIFT